MTIAGIIVTCASARNAAREIKAYEEEEEVDESCQEAEEEEVPARTAG